jgi:hypothetical protein
VRLLPFWTAIWPLVLIPHWRAIWENLPRTLHSVPKEKAPAKVSGARFFALACGLASLTLLVFSHSGRWLLGQIPPSLNERYQPGTPLSPAKDLQQDRSMPWRVFCSPHWSDYLVWALPPGDVVYWYSHWHCYSPKRMIDGNRLLGRRDPPDGWRSVLDRYRFNCLALLREEEPMPLYDYLAAQRDQSGAEWDVTEYKTGLVARRRSDPFVNGLLGAQAAQACVAGQGLMPMAGGWGFLTHLPWYWKE